MVSKKKRMLGKFNMTVAVKNAVVVTLITMFSRLATFGATPIGFLDLQAILIAAALAGLLSYEKSSSDANATAGSNSLINLCGEANA